MKTIIVSLQSKILINMLITNQEIKSKLLVNNIRINGFLVLIIVHTVKNGRLLTRPQIAKDSRFALILELLQVPK